MKKGKKVTYAKVTIEVKARGPERTGSVQRTDVAH